MKVNKARLALKKTSWTAALFVFLFLAGMGTASAADIYSTTFANGAWNANDWILVKSARWDYFGGWIQQADHIENETPDGVSEEDMLVLPWAAETYTSMVYENKVKGDVTVTSTMEFSYRMAPLIVIATELGEDGEGQKEYREHFEFVLYDQGINVWYHHYNGGPWWEKIASSSFSFSKDTQYTMEVAKKGKDLTVTVGAHTLSFTENSFPEEFYAGITGCEGVNLFYDFSITDTMPPTVMVTSAVISGSASDDSGGVGVKVAGSSVPVIAGAWQSGELPVGDFPVPVTARDATDNTTTVTVDVQVP